VALLEHTNDNTFRGFSVKGELLKLELVCPPRKLHVDSFEEPRPPMWATFSDRTCRDSRAASPPLHYFLVAMIGYSVSKAKNRA
jgi:hypothetical protein